MSFRIKLHYDNALGFETPHLWIRYAGSATPDDRAPTGTDTFGFVYEIEVERTAFHLKFKDGPGTTGPWEGPELGRIHRSLQGDTLTTLIDLWCKGTNAFLYLEEPRVPESLSAREFLQQLPFPAGTYISETGGFSGLGATVLADGRLLFVSSFSLRLLSSYEICKSGAPARQETGYGESERGLFRV